MARGGDRYAILFDAARRWKERCLLADGSVLSDQVLWTTDNIQQLVRYFVENLDTGEGSFLSKLRVQLEPASPGAKKLAAEMLWVMYLIVSPDSMGADRKRLQVEQAWQWSGESAPDAPEMLGAVMGAGVANPGTAYHTHRWRELVFFIRLMERWKALPGREREKLLAGQGWDLAEWVDAQQESKGRLFRHALLFLLFPDHFAAIVSKQHKRAIVERWYAEASGGDDPPPSSDRVALDKALDTIRTHLREKHPDFDFYREPWLSQWKPTRPGDGPVVAPGDEQDAEAWAQERFGAARVWVIAPGEGARLWPEFLREGIMAVGFDDLPDLSEYSSREELSHAITETTGVVNPINDSLAGWQFVNEIEVGDYVIAKEGRSKVLGWGIVSSEYRYAPERLEYRNVRDVEWKARGEWVLPEGRRLNAKTLTDFTRYKQWLHMAFQLMEKEEGTHEKGGGPGYPLERAAKDLFITPERLSEIVNLLARKKNVILKGPPGTGKTFIARRIAYRLMDAEDEDRVQMVQFHQAYSYEDFVQGYRPDDGGGFRVKDGVFYQFSRRAAADPGNKYVFIIDEINRGNLPRILGELMLLIEADKRSESYAIPLTYSCSDDDLFYVPENLYLLAMMNTADRSLALVDYALRRRFAFVGLRPEFESDSFADYLMDAGVDAELVKKISKRMTELNKAIANDRKNLGRGFEIGHSYFVPTEQDTEVGEEWYERVVRTEVEPLLGEYWFDEPNRVADYVKELLL